MTQTEGRKLDSGDLFPKMELQLTDGNNLILPDTAQGQWTVLLVYRGRW